MEREEMKVTCIKFGEKKSVSMVGKTKSLVCANKKGSTWRTGVDRGERKGRKGRRTYRGKKWRGPFFGRIYRSRIVYVCLRVGARAREFEQLNHRNFISVGRGTLPFVLSSLRGILVLDRRGGGVRSEFLPFLGRKPTLRNL